MAKYLWELLWAFVLTQLRRWEFRVRRLRCLMIVENDREAGDVLKALVETEGYRCHVVNLAETAWALLRSQPERYPLVFVDLKLTLGFEQGAELAGKVLREFPHKHVVIVTGDFGRLTAMDREEAFVVLGKPYSLFAVQRILRKLRIR